MGKTMLVFGHGYTAHALSPLLIADGWRVVGTSRDAGTVDAMNVAGVDGRLWPGDNLVDVWDDVSAILVSIAPDAEGDPVLNAVGKKIAQLAGQISWLGYLSTTAVYGDHQGGWVDETTSLAPTTERGKWRMGAERGWLDLANCFDLPLSIFRLAGIYGFGRGPFAKVRAGTTKRIVKEGQVFGRIHVDDIATALLASIHRPDVRGIYNLCDDLAAPPQDVLAYAAELLALPLPESVNFADAEMSAMARSFYAESKRVRNELIKRELNFSLMYPTYREGLRALLLQESRS